MDQKCGKKCQKEAVTDLVGVGYLEGLKDDAGKDEVDADDGDPFAAPASQRRVRTSSVPSIIMKKSSASCLARVTAIMGVFFCFLSGRVRYGPPGCIISAAGRREQ